MQSRVGVGQSESREDEAALVAACRAGDPRARRQLWERLAPRVLAIATHFHGGGASGRAIAADVAQEVLVKVFTRMDQYRGDAALMTWVHRMTVNACLDEARSRRRLVPLEAVAEDAAPGADPEAAAEDASREALVRRAVMKLPEKLRIAVLLRHFEDLSYDEMAEALGCSAGTVASRLSRGHALLARELRALGGAS